MCDSNFLVQESIIRTGTSGAPGIPGATGATGVGIQGATGAQGPTGVSLTRQYLQTEIQDTVHSEFGGSFIPFNIKFSVNPSFNNGFIISLSPNDTIIFNSSISGNFQVILSGYITIEITAPLPPIPPADAYLNPIITINKNGSLIGIPQHTSIYIDTYGKQCFLFNTCVIIDLTSSDYINFIVSPELSYSGTTPYVFLLRGILDIFQIG